MFSQKSAILTAPTGKITTVKVVLIGDNEAKKAFIDNLPSRQNTNSYKGLLGVDFAYIQMDNIHYQISELSSSPRFAHMYPTYIKNANTIIFIEASQAQMTQVAQMINETIPFDNIYLTEFDNNLTSAEFLQAAVKRETNPICVSTTTMSELNNTELAEFDHRPTFNPVCDDKLFKL